MLLISIADSVLKFLRLIDSTADDWNIDEKSVPLVGLKLDKSKLFNFGVFTNIYWNEFTFRTSKLETSKLSKLLHIWNI